MGRNLALVAVITLLLAPYLALSQPRALSFAIQAVDSAGRPIEGAIVMAFSLRTIRAVYLSETNSSGWAIGSIPSGDYYIFYVLKSERGIASHVPVKIDLSGHPGATSLTARAVLYPVARVIVTGRAVYIGGMPTGAVQIHVLSREGDPLSISLRAGDAAVAVEGRELLIAPQVVDVYGTSADYMFIKRGLGFELVRANEGLVPLGVPVRVRVEYGVLDLLRYVIRSLGVERGSRETPLVFTSPEIVEVDLLRVSLEGQLQSVKSDVAKARELVSWYESLGFYIPEIHDLVKRGETLTRAADVAFEGGKPAEAVLAPLESAHMIANILIPRRLGFLRDVARVGATVMPSFLAVFAAILAFYFLNSRRAKMLSFTFTYAALVVAFSQVYPGFKLLWELDRQLFLTTVTGAYALFFTVVFVLPRVVKEPELPGEVALGGLVAVAFTLGKRYSKVKALRTFITAFSIAAFIWAFTVLATFGTVYARIEERGFASYPVNVLIVKRIANDTYRPLNPDLDPLLFKERGEVRGLAIMLFNNPDVSVTAAVSYFGREVRTRFLMGIDPEELRINPRLAECFKLVKPLTNESVLLPYSTWRALNLKGGERVRVVIEVLGVEGRTKVELNLVASGYFVERALEQLRDPDGMPVRPFTFRGATPLYANGSDILVVTSSLLLRYLSPTQVYMYRLVSTPTSEEEGFSFAKEVVDRRGEEYVVITCYGGSCSRMYYGTRVQTIFEQGVTFLVPLLIVIANVLISMLSVVKERRREIFIFMCVGFNPRHIALVFLAEAIIYGLLSGGFGYVAGLTTFRLLGLFAAHHDLMVYEKLEWYWSYLAIALAVVVSIVGAIKPSVDAAYMFLPTKVKRVKISEERERARREEIVTRTVAAKMFSIPGDVMADEADVAFSYVYSRFVDLSYGELEAVTNLTDHPMEERPDGTQIKRFTFTYVSTTELGEKVMIECELRFILSPSSNEFRVELDTKPIGQAPISHMDYAADLIKKVVSDWMSEREKLLYSA